MSSSRPTAISSGAQYQAIPQAPVAPVPAPFLEERDDNDDSDALGHIVPHDASTVPEIEVTTKILWIHFILGCAVLLPWNVMITAMPYFLSQLQGTSLRGTFSSYMSTSFTVANFVVLAIATATSKQASQSRRITISTLCLAFLTFLLTLTTFLTLPPKLFFFLILLNGVVQAYAGGYLQTSVVVIGALFGPQAMQAVMSGQAAVAVIVSGVQVVSSALSVWGQDAAKFVADAETDGKAETSAAFMFFALSTLFLLATVGAYMWLKKLPVYKLAIEGMQRQGGAARDGDEEERRGLVSSSPAKGSDGGNKEQIMRVAKANALSEIAVAYVFIVTLAVFPAITVSVTPTNPNTHPLLFSAIHFFVFNVGDFVGRYSCSFPRFRIWSQRKLLLIALGRTVFIPIFLMCNVQRGSSLTVSKPPVISSDVLFMFILLLCGLTTGHVSTLCIMSASSLEHNKKLQGREDVDVAATVGSFFLVGGLAVGSAASFLVRYWICDCNPFKS